MEHTTLSSLPITSPNNIARNTNSNNLKALSLSDLRQELWNAHKRFSEMMINGRIDDLIKTNTEINQIMKLIARHSGR